MGLLVPVYEIVAEPELSVEVSEPVLVVEPGAGEVDPGFPIVSAVKYHLKEKKSVKWWYYMAKSRIL